MLGDVERGYESAEGPFVSFVLLFGPQEETRILPQRGVRGRLVAEHLSDGRMSGCRSRQCGHDVAASVFDGVLLPAGCAIETFEEVAAEVDTQVVPILGEEFDQDLVNFIFIENANLDAGNLPRVADGFSDSVDEGEIFEQEHPNPGQLPTL